MPRRLYAIGDIHGCIDLLDGMIELIARDVGSGSAGDCLTVTLGDCIDRGPASRAVVDRLAENVVHGHTPVAEPEIRRNRINVDTGAFMTGRLTCVVLEDERIRLLTAL